MENKLIYVDKGGEHEVKITEFIEGKTFDEMMKAIGRSEEDFSKLKDYKRATNDKALLKLAEFFYDRYMDVTTYNRPNTAGPSTDNIQDKMPSPKVEYKREMVSIDDMDKFGENMRM